MILEYEIPHFSDYIFPDIPFLSLKVQSKGLDIYDL